MKLKTLVRQLALFLFVERRVLAEVAGCKSYFAPTLIDRTGIFKYEERCL